jgi:hypothetical protein
MSKINESNSRDTRPKFLIESLDSTFLNWEKQLNDLMSEFKKTGEYRELREDENGKKRLLKLENFWLEFLKENGILYKSLNGLMIEIEKKSREDILGNKRAVTFLDKWTDRHSGEEKQEIKTAKINARQIENRFLKTLDSLFKQGTMKARDILEKPNVGIGPISPSQLFDSIKEEFLYREEIDNYFNTLKPENRILTDLIKRHGSFDRQNKAELNRENSILLPEKFIDKTWTLKDGSTIGVFELKQVKDFEIETYLNDHCVKNGSWQKQTQRINEKGLQEAVMLSVSVELKNPDTIGNLLSQQKRGSRYLNKEEVKSFTVSRLPMITIEYQREGGRIGQVKFAGDRTLQRTDPDYFVYMEVLKSIYERLIFLGYQVNSFGSDLQSLKKEGTFLNIQGEDLSIKELANRDLSKEIIIAGGIIRPTETDLGNDESERIKNLNALCNLSNVTLDLTNLPNKYKKEIKRIRGNLIDNSENSDKNIGSYEKLVSIGGYLYAGNSKDLQLNALTSIGGNLNAYGTTNLQLNALASVGGSLSANRATNLQLNALTSVGGYLDVQNSKDLQLNALTSVGGSLSANRATNLQLDTLVSVVGNLDASFSENLDLNALTSVGGRLEARESINLQLNALTSIGGDLYASGATNLQLKALDKVKNIYINENTKKLLISKRLKSDKIVFYNRIKYSPEEIIHYMESKFENPGLREILDPRCKIPTFIYTD